MPVIFASQKKFDEEVSKRAAVLCDQLILEMGAELHDDLIQKLSIFRLYLDRLERNSHDRSEVESLLIKMRTDFESVTQSVRRIAGSFLPEPIYDQSFNTSLKALCKSLEKPGLGSIYFQAIGNEQTIAENIQRYLYRIVQELIHNSFKHSSAWHIYVLINWTPDKLLITVEDDGSGFNKVAEFIEKLRKKNNTLRLRSQAIGATITYHHGSKGLLASVEYLL
jgi:signal transduction histidine kinase